MRLIYEILRQITSIIEITNLNVEGCKSYLPVFSIICQYFPVNATGMANLLICRHFANLEKILKGFYQIWAWRPSWSCDLNILNKIWLSYHQESSHEI